MPEISIIVPVYNVKDYLTRCLDSILAQTFTDFDIYIVDDGSTDGTAEICDRYKALDSRITVIHKPNEGVSVARNTAIAMAEGKYFLFFDGDDHVEPYCLEELHAAAVENNADAVLYGYYLEQNGEIIETHLPSMERDIYEGDEVFNEILPRFIGVSCDDIRRWIKGDSSALQKENTALWRSMVRGSLIKDNGLIFKPQLRVGEDTCFSTEYLSLAKKCVVLHKCYYYLSVRETSTIYVYERNPMSVCQGKTDLLSARRELTERIISRGGGNIEQLWYGSVIMSCIQLALMLSKKCRGTSLKQRYAAYKRYVLEEETQRAIKSFDIKLSGVKSLPFLLLCDNHYFIIFAAMCAVNLLPYKFKR